MAARALKSPVRVGIDINQSGKRIEIVPGQAFWSTESLFLQGLANSTFIWIFEIMRKMTTAVALCLVGMSLSFGGAAQAAEHNSNINPWRDCGIGAAIFTDNGTAAAISNIIWDSGTTAVTSATITPNSCSGEEIKVAQLIDQTYDALVMQTAAGSGDHVAAVMDLAGCSVTARNDVIAGVRSSLMGATAVEGYPSLAHQNKAYAYYQSLSHSAWANGACNG